MRSGCCAGRRVSGCRAAPTRGAMAWRWANRSLPRLARILRSPTGATGVQACQPSLQEPTMRRLASLAAALLLPCAALAQETKEIGHVNTALTNLSLTRSHQIVIER